ncbi:hypothetical protein CKO25_09380 [Thiocapsa imhoffii]|uniref:O-antigen ligase-related domain-containing protein n=1 Tax=Thiocapsa imhoffii TaxID=382777 RepID=A0A9X1B9A9_9GAMM|nr:O-antigen ligase family protein [Thiocapsa imhoffii]MBK1644856.1 hypothetical protein [Thiocapsa imhoffii]
MELTSEHWFQLNLAAALAVLAFIAVYTAPIKWVVLALIIILPFQIISSRYGSFNIYLIYLVSFVFIIRGQLREFPLIYYVFFIALAYFISFSFVLPVTRGDHLLYLFFIGSNFLIFYISYNYFKYKSNEKDFFLIFMVLTGLILLYSLAQLIVGMDPNSPLFGEKFGLRPPREDGRLTGPFSAVGLTAEYMVIAIFTLSYILVTTKPNLRLRFLIWSMIMASFAAMIATANRGAIITLVICGIFYLLIFRKELGTRGILQAVVGIPFAFALASAIVINFTDFNRLFDRLSETEVEEGIPDTRSVVWPLTWERIQLSPIVGNGPQWKLSEETYQKRGVLKQIPMPHNLYLYIVGTIGVIGLIAYLFFWMRMMYFFYQGAFSQFSENNNGSIPKLALILMAVFFIDQMKVEFLRSETTEFQHVMFMLWGALLALSSKSTLRSLSTADHN